jgi:hypothetical protein
MSDELQFRCRCDKWQGVPSEMLTAPHPFIDGDTMLFCPVCKSNDEFFNVCDEPECKNEATSGTPTPNGYRSTCYKHAPR